MVIGLEDYPLHFLNSILMPPDKMVKYRQLLIELMNLRDQVGIAMILSEFSKTGKRRALIIVGSLHSQNLANILHQIGIFARFYNTYYSAQR
jgi:hypothetical protein